MNEQIEMYTWKNKDCQYNLTLSSRFTSLANHQAIVVKKGILATLHSVNVKTNKKIPQIDYYNIPHAFLPFGSKK